MLTFPAEYGLLVPPVAQGLPKAIFRRPNHPQPKIDWALQFYFFPRDASFFVHDELIKAAALTQLASTYSAQLNRHYVFRREDGGYRIYRTS
ncbi:hypothetical protein [Sphingomonas psychrolutea]|uniref:Uncharacterized protein n=1 Tax=Sphingomonas psychrolutea TaxID=1259676 RepID=A0ABQ1GWR5_9SPHN|nr:hypothetical protein [Sphingomonas psychrolutea]GGA51941.1 hypothetical protein GCM10011395_22870 [Sphingomonas psychrolutea]